MTEPFYRAFEDRYRGSRDVIKQRLRAYAPFLEPLVQAQQPQALDLGCGRGEWLELLGEYGFNARGVDLDDGMLAACRERGLQVETGDAVAALRACPDHSLALVSAFHLVEHIPFELVQEITREAQRALQPGGLLIMETPNPENLVVGASSFYMDPSHLRPIPPSLLAFTAEHAGYQRHKVVRLQEEPALHSDRPLALIHVLEGPSPDYSVVAQTSAPAEILTRFDTAFATDYGIALGPLALRYEQQHEQRLAELHLLAQAQQREAQQLHQALQQQAQSLEHQSQSLQQQAQSLQQQAQAQQQQQAEHEQLAASLTQLSHSLDLAHAHAAHQAEALNHAGHRLGLLEQRTEAAEARADAAQQHVIALLSSSSWRLTAPLRKVVTLGHRVRNGGRRRLKALIVRAGQAVLRRPALKRLARPLLRLVPGLQSRLYGMVIQAQAAPAAAVLLQEAAPGQLSPRTARIFQELKKVQETRNR
ncbi:methyltransferase domain-containing protein [Duganella sp. FT80W]|uniref:Methyltransferase domain-containing protein n=1 Tax=Duganella guangzhouensis TaxID=2666084 RepID=A0A6I2L3B4_9BURK|nr:class I SAM-dependent methyltransferase [Duganella guangzhouensis]MRW92611.1 methyltransferase domain-containing protein [Duganella guangzhouensis]